MVIIGSIASIGILVGGAGYFLQAWRKGSKEEKTEVVSSADQLSSFWKEQVDGFKEVVATLQEKINTMTGEIGELRGQLNEKTKQAAEYKEILQGQNPEMKQFMETMLAVSEQSQKFMADNVGFQQTQSNVMTEIKDFMSQINANLSLVNKDLKIEATVTKQ